MKDLCTWTTRLYVCITEYQWGNNGFVLWLGQRTCNSDYIFPCRVGPRIAVHGSLTILAIADDYTAPNRKLLTPYYFVLAIYIANWFDKNKAGYYHSEIPSKVVVEQSDIYR